MATVLSVIIHIFIIVTVTCFYLSYWSASPQGHKAGMWLEMLQTAVRLDVKGFRLPYLFKLHTKQMLKGKYCSSCLLLVLIV